MRIISLSSIPPRFPSLYKSLETLVAQGVADEIRLYIPTHYRRFPDHDGQLPDVPDGVKICQISEDLGPATKILPAVKDFKNQNVQILFCDDDSDYPLGWAKRLFKIQAKRKSQAVATLGRGIGCNVLNKVSPRRWPYARQIRIEYDLQYRAGRVLEKVFGFKPHQRPIIFPGYADIFFGVAGVVVRPDFFDDDAFKIPDEAWAVDDIWLSAQLARKDIPIYCPWRLPCPRATEGSGQNALLDLIFLGSERQELNSRAAVLCQEMYGIWKK